ncbi:alpha/beta hydrolase [Streptococcaceae bacterium ESL0729]|nr:alpha/beta hydrolase [Streptococcaceae bacterium ESL0729]
MKKILLKILLVIILTVLGLFVWFYQSPRPGAFIIRQVFDLDARKKKEEMEQVLPSFDVELKENINYQSANSKSLLDIYLPTKFEGKLPVIVWTHGGAWISGDKSDTSPYFKMLAASGFAVVALNYDLAPQKKYPTALNQLNAAYKFINDQASSYHFDSSKIILAGDSAGAQLSAQMATLITNETYASKLGIKANLARENLLATVLYCGIYDMKTLAQGDASSSAIISWGFKTATWAYLGSKDINNPLYLESSPDQYVNKDFPQTFISGGNGDGLTKTQSLPFSEKLKDLGVEVRELFYPHDYEPVQKHENQFVLDQSGLANFEAMVAFLKERISQSEMNHS